MTATVRTPNPLPSLADLSRELIYERHTGLFVWREGVPLRGRAKAGNRAGKRLPNGYRQIIWHGQPCYEHRLAWLFVSREDPGPLTVDHINRVPNDNRAKNLRLATQSMQNRNQGSRSDNTSGIRGVHYCNTAGVWIARAWDGGRLVWTGRGHTKEEAAEKRRQFIEANQ